MKTLKPFIIAFAVCGLGGAPAIAAPQAPAATAEAPRGDIVIANVNGLVCDFCAQSIRKLFGNEAAIADVAVDLDNGKVTLFLKSGQAMDDAAIEKLIRRAGYSLVSIDRSTLK